MSDSPEASYFGPPDRPLFGWLHAPGAGSRAPLGLVICNPFGYESICAHRTLRDTAIAAADAGIWTLRFDYDGTGDSSGSDTDPARLRAWLDSIHHAIDFLRARAAVAQIALFGIRMGAALATLAAVERSDVDGVIAFAPALNGRAYLREMRALQLATGLAPAASDAGDTEATGFVLTAETQRTVAGIDLRALEQLPARNILILDRDDLSGSDAWAERLRTLGATVELARVHGFVEMMQSPHSTIVPLQMVTRAIRWVSSRASVLRLAESVAEASSGVSAMPAAYASDMTSARLSASSVVERVCRIGDSRELFGILATSDTLPSPQAGVILLNAGATHHIGPNRLYVTLARQLAARGMAVLRMDVSGIGDSPPRAGEKPNVVYSRRAGEDLCCAIDCLRRTTGVTRCFALGLCSGAYHALKGSLAGALLDSLVMINPLTFYWHDGMSLDAKMPAQWVIAESSRYQQTFFRLAPWIKLLKGEVDIRNILSVFSLRAGTTLKYSLRDVARQLRIPLKNDLGRELTLISGRGIGLTFVFSRGDPGFDLLRIEGGSPIRKLLRRGRMQVHVIDAADHTFTPRLAREQLQSLVIREFERLGVA